jgi:hypothetical protein
VVCRYLASGLGAQRDLIHAPRGSSNGLLSVVQCPAAPPPDPHYLRAGDCSTLAGCGRHWLEARITSGLGRGHPVSCSCSGAGGPSIAPSTSASCFLLHLQAATPISNGTRILRWGSQEAEPCRRGSHVVPFRLAACARQRMQAIRVGARESKAASLALSLLYLDTRYFWPAARVWQQPTRSPVLHTTAASDKASGTTLEGLPVARAPTLLPIHVHSGLHCALSCHPPIATRSLIRPIPPQQGSQGPFA